MKMMKARKSRIRREVDDAHLWFTDEGEIFDQLRIIN